MSTHDEVMNCCPKMCDFQFNGPSDRCRWLFSAEICYFWPLVVFSMIWSDWRCSKKFKYEERDRDLIHHFYEWFLESVSSRSSREHWNSVFKGEGLKMGGFPFWWNIVFFWKTTWKYSEQKSWKHATAPMKQQHGKPLFSHALTSKSLGSPSWVVRDTARLVG